MSDVATYPIVIMLLPEEDGGGFGGFVPDLRGCMGDGETAEEALIDTRAAIAEWIDEARRLKRKIPLPGSAAKRAKKEIKNLKNLVCTQDRVLQTQDEALNAARAEIESIKARMQEVEACDEDFMSSSWQDEAAVMLVARKRRRDDNLPH